MGYYIVEHLTRGVLVDYGPDGYGTGTNTYGGHWSTWSWSKPRAEAHHFSTKAGAALARDRLKPSIRRGADVRRSGDWDVVA